MIHKLIQTENYLLVVDNEEIKEGDYRLNIQRNTIYFVDEDPLYFNKRNDVFKKIISHLPLNNSPILEGVPLLPPLEDDVEKLAEEYGELICNKDGTARFDFKRGYNKAKEKYKYTEEDLRKAFFSGGNFKDIKEFDYLIQSLQQPKIPVEFERKFLENKLWGQKGTGVYITETNSQGLTQWVGKYIY